MGLCLGRKSFSHQRIYERKISPLPSGYNNEDGELENFEIVPEKVDRVYDVERVHMVVRRLRFFKYYSPHVSTYVYFRGRMPYGNAIVFFEMYATFPPPPFLPRGVIYLSVKYNYPPLLTEICYLYVEPRHCLPGGATTPESGRDHANIPSGYGRVVLSSLPNEEAVVWNLGEAQYDDYKLCHTLK